MARINSKYDHKKMIKFLTVRYKLGFNNDENEVNSLGHHTRSYEYGTSRLGRRSYKLGSGANVDLGYEKKKLE